jgi:hypothetical protein
MSENDCCILAIYMDNPYPDPVIMLTSKQRLTLSTSTHFSPPSAGIPVVSQECNDNDCLICILVNKVNGFLSWMKGKDMMTNKLFNSFVNATVFPVCYPTKGGDVSYFCLQQQVCLTFNRTCLIVCL